MSNKENEKELHWILAKDNPWGIDILDMRPISQAMISTSEDPLMAQNAVSYNAEDGSTFWGQMPKSDRKIETSLTLPISGKLYPGVLFMPNTMEHKWAIYFDGKLIYFIRSWHREVYVVAETRQEENKLIIENIQGRFVGDEEGVEFTEATLQFLLASHALNEIVPAPLPIDIKDDTYSAGLWSFSTFGNMAHYGVFDYQFRVQPQKPLCTHSLLHIAVARTDMNGIEKYIKEGFDIHALAGDGLSPLHWAVSTISLEKLLELGANPNVKSSQGATPIMNAVQSDRLDHLKILIDAGADINAQDSRGFTALHRASEMGKVDIVKYLLEKGANIAIVAQGYTALSLAEAMKNEEIIEWLKEQ